MATSGTYSFTVTRDDIIRQALLNIKKLGEYETPTAGQTTDCARVLNMIVKQWQAKQDFANGLKMWTRRHSTLFLGAAQFQYNAGPTGDHWTSSYATNTLASNAALGASTITLQAPFTSPINGDNIGIILSTGDIFWTKVNGVPVGAVVTLLAVLPASAPGATLVFNYTTKAQRPVLIETVVLRDSNFVDIPMNIYDLQTYDYQSQKQSPQFVSDPIAIYYEAQLGNGVIYIDCAGAQDVTKRLYISYMEPTMDFNNPLDTPEYPAEFFLALCWELSFHISPMFRAVWTPEMKAARDSSTLIAKEGYSETSSLFFQPGNE